MDPLAFATDTVLKGTLVLALSGLALLALRRASAATRHFVGTLGLAASLAVPLLALVLPRWQVPLLPRPVLSRAIESILGRSAPPTPAASSTSARQVIHVRIDTYAPGVPDLGGTQAQGMAGAPRIAEHTSATASAPRDASPLRFGHVGVDPGGAGAVSGPIRARISGLLAQLAEPGVLLLVWFLGSLFFLVRLAAALLGVVRISRETFRVTGADWTALADAARRELRIGRPVPLFHSSRVTVPVTAGAFTPSIVLPEDARDWTPSRRRVVLLHELAHVARHDGLVHFLAGVATALYWFHPLAWLVARSVRLTSEQASDDRVLLANTRPSAYAEELLAILKALRGPVPMSVAALGLARPSHFEERLRAILDPECRREAPPRRVAGAAAAALFIAAGVLASVQPWAVPVAEAASTGSDPASGFAFEVVTHLQTGERTSISEDFSESTSVGKHVVLHASARPCVESAQPVIVEATPSGLDGDWKRLATSSGAVLAGRRSEPQSGSGWYSRGMDLHNDDRWDEAIAAFQKAIELGYKEGAATYNIACGYALKGDKDRAFEWLRKAQEVGFDVSSYLGHDSDLDGLRSDSRWKEIKNFPAEHRSSRKKDEERAVSARAERLLGRPDAPGESLFQAGRELLNARAYELSFKAFKSAADKGYREATSLYNAACALSRKGDLAQALDLLDKALEAGFDNPHLIDRDDDLDNIRDEPRFKALQEKAEELNLSGFDGFSWVFRSTQRAHWREVAKRLEGVARKDPKSGRAWFNLGYAQLAGERPEAAAEAFHRALDLGYRKPTTLFNLACSHARLSETDKAFDWLFKAIDAGFDNAGQIRSDEDLDALRGDARFGKALKLVKEKAREKEG